MQELFFVTSEIVFFCYTKKSPHHLWQGDKQRERQSGGREGPQRRWVVYAALLLATLYNVLICIARTFFRENGELGLAPHSRKEAPPCLAKSYRNALILSMIDFSIIVL